MKFKTLNNKTELVSLNIFISIITSIPFILNFSKSNNYWLLIFLTLTLILINSIILRKITTISFYKDSIEIVRLFAKIQTIDTNKDSIIISLLPSSKSIVSPKISLKVEKKHIANFSLNKYEWELEQFYYHTTNSGIKWRIYDGARKGFAANYELYLKRKKIMDSNR